MKVLVCIPCLLTGGTEIQTLSLVKALVAGGHTVTTLCYFEHSDIMVKQYRASGSDVVLLSPEGKRPVSTKNVVWTLWKGIRRAVNDFKPDVAHVQYMAPGAIPIAVLKLVGVKRIFATAHTSGDIYSSLRLIHWLNDNLLTAFQCITLKAEASFFGSCRLMSEYTKLRKHGNHFTVYNCLPEYINVRDDDKVFPNDVITVGVVSRLEIIKGMDLVVPSFAKVKRYFPNVCLLIVGDGSLRDMMVSQAIESGVSDAVDFVGRQPQVKLQEYYDKIDILLMPSRSEGFGLTAIEGMARGCVPLVADTGGLPEVVQDGVNGLLHKPEDIDDISNKISRLIKDRPILQQLSDAAIQRAEVFSFETYKKSINGLYNLLK